MKRLTGKQLAELLNLSPSTISNVLNGRYDRVSEATKKRVWDAVEEHGIRHIENRDRRRALERRNIAFIVMSEHSNEWFLGNLNGIAETCRKRNYILSQVLFPVWDPDYFRFVFSNLDFCGALLITTMNHPVTDLLRTFRIPYVMIDSYDDESKYNTVHLDNFQGAFAAVDYLIQLGHRRIGFLGGEHPWSSAVYRERGYRAALEKHGIACDPKLEYNASFTHFGGLLGAEILLDRNPDMTAIFAASDEMAMGALKTISELGLSVPGDLSVIGFDGHNLGQVSHVPLTTVQTNPFMVGVNACEMLIGMLESGSSEVAKVVMDVVLSVRGTTGRPKTLGLAK
ncbi:MAG TPA: LacI family transcriptional regulator [Firmicutes bacterium]|nr:LacI family transcriptional regulator [Bacillota bacterium]